MVHAINELVFFILAKYEPCTRHSIDGRVLTNSLFSIFATYHFSENMPKILNHVFNDLFLHANWIAIIPISLVFIATDKMEPLSD